MEPHRTIVGLPSEPSISLGQDWRDDDRSDDHPLSDAQRPTLGFGIAHRLVQLRLIRSFCELLLLVDVSQSIA